MSIGDIVISIAVGLAINECCDVSPWGARKLVRWAAQCRHHSNPGRAQTRAEEWAAIIDDRPGKLFKLTTALCLALAAVVHRTVSRRARGRAPATDGHSGVFTARLRRRLAAAGLAGSIAGIAYGAVGAVAEGLVVGSDEMWVAGAWLAMGAGLAGVIESVRPAVVPAGLASGLTNGLAFGIVGATSAASIGEWLGIGLTFAFGTWLAARIAVKLTQSFRTGRAVACNAILAASCAFGTVCFAAATMPYGLALFAFSFFMSLGAGFAAWLGAVTSQVAVPPGGTASARGADDSSTTLSVSGTA